MEVKITARSFNPTYIQYRSDPVQDITGVSGQRTVDSLKDARVKFAALKLLHIQLNRYRRSEC